MKVSKSQVRELSRTKDNVSELEQLRRANEEKDSRIKELEGQLAEMEELLALKAT